MLICNVRSFPVLICDMRFLSVLLGTSRVRVTITLRCSRVPSCSFASHVRTHYSRYARSSDFGNDSFASQSLLRSHVAQTHELVGFRKQLSDLREQSMHIKTVPLPDTKAVVKLGSPPYTSGSTSLDGAGAAGAPSVTRVKARADFQSRRDRELTITKGEILEVVKDTDAKWWKVRTAADLVSCCE